MTVQEIIPQLRPGADAEARKRLSRLSALDSDRMTMALTWLAGYSPLPIVCTFVLMISRSISDGAADRSRSGADQAFPPELSIRSLRRRDSEQRRRPLPPPLMVYFVLALWLFLVRNCGYSQVMLKLADGLYCQRRSADLLARQLDPDSWVDAGQGRRWKQPNISSLSRGRGKLSSDPVRMLFEHVAGPTGADGAPGVFCCGLRVVSVDGSTTDVPDSEKNAAYFGCLRTPPGTARSRSPVGRSSQSGTGSLLSAALGPYTAGEQSLALDLLDCLGPGMLVLADRNFLSWSLARAVLATRRTSCGAPRRPSP